MKKLGIYQMEMIEGGTNSGKDATLFMCGAAVFLTLTPAALLSVGPWVGCATGLAGWYAYW